MMDFLNSYAFAITIVFIVLSTLIAAFIRRTKRDKCLKEFRGCMVTVEDTGGKEIWGRLNVENTGLELVYTQAHEDTDGHLETSYILYKHEYAKIQMLVRYHDQLSDKNKKQRQRAPRCRCEDLRATKKHRHQTDPLTLEHRLEWNYYCCDNL